MRAHGDGSIGDGALLAYGLIIAVLMFVVRTAKWAIGSAQGSRQGREQGPGRALGGPGGGGHRWRARLGQLAPGRGCDVVNRTIHRNLSDDLTSLLPMLPTLIAVVAIAVIVTAWLLWRSSRWPNVPRTQVPSNAQPQIELRPEFPPAGLLVPEGVLRSAGSTSAAIWDALDAAAVPIAVEYFPVTASEIAKFRTVL
jgi:Family of unknown function (DUF6112)